MAVAWLTTARYFLVPRLVDETVLVVDVDAVPKLVQAVPDHSCHWYETPVGPSTVAFRVTVLLLASPDSGKSGEDVTVTTSGFHWTAIGGDSEAEPVVGVTTTLKNFVPAVVDVAEY